MFFHSLETSVVERSVELYSIMLLWNLWIVRRALSVTNTLLAIQGRFCLERIVYEIIIITIANKRRVLLASVLNFRRVR